MPSAESTRRQSRLEDIRGGLHSLFSGESGIEARSPSPEIPKAPRFVGLGNLPSTRIYIPGLNSNRSSMRRSSAATEPILPEHEESALPPVASRSTSRLSQSTLFPTVSSPVSTIPPQVQRRSDRRFLSVDPAERHLADLADRGRGRREAQRGTHESRRTCALNVRNKIIRQKLVHSLISGLVCVLYHVYLFLLFFWLDSNSICSFSFLCSQFILHWHCRIRMKAKNSTFSSF